MILYECTTGERPFRAATLHDSLRATIHGEVERGVRRREDHGIWTLEVSLPGRSLSSQHARLVRVGATWAIEDLGSKNGTFVNGERVTQAVLRPGDLCELGHTLVRINPSLPLPEGAPLDLDLQGSESPGLSTLDPSLSERVESLETLVRSDVPILLTGESGTGKEVLARRLHERTGRPGPFVAVNCGAIPTSLAEAQLFGHLRGAFSGAVRDELGFVRAAHGGTLLLDEIAELSKSAQVALLRVLEGREVVPIGTASAVSVDVYPNLPLGHIPGIVGDIAGQAFGVTFGTGLGMAFQIRRALRLGKVGPVEASMLSPGVAALVARFPLGTFRRSVGLGALSVPIFALPVIVGLTVLGIGSLERLPFVVLKGGFAALQAAMVTPLLAVAALDDVSRKAAA